MLRYINEISWFCFKYGDELNRGGVLLYVLYFCVFVYLYKHIFKMRGNETFSIDLLLKSYLLQSSAILAYNDVVANLISIFQNVNDWFIYTSKLCLKIKFSCWNHFLCCEYTCICFSVLHLFIHISMWRNFNKIFKE